MPVEQRDAGRKIRERTEIWKTNRIKCTGSHKLNYRLESRMRETRQSGSEGGESQANVTSLPLSKVLYFKGTVLPTL